MKNKIIFGGYFFVLSSLVLALWFLGGGFSRDLPTSNAKSITYVVPTPEPIQIFWIDSAGNLGLRGVDAVIPGVPDEKSKLSESCRKSAATNGNGTLTVCMSPAVGRVLAKELGFDK